MLDKHSRELHPLNPTFPTLMPVYSPHHVIIHVKYQSGIKLKHFAFFSTAVKQVIDKNAILE